MERREALLLTATVVGGTLIGSEFFLSGCARKTDVSSLFSDADLLILDEVGETILPETDRSPGAKAAKIGLFMKTIVSDCYSEKEQTIFINGILELDNLSKNAYGNGFLKLEAKQRYALIDKLDKTVRNTKNTTAPHFFQMMKELTLWGYFTSEPGATKALRYQPVPGVFKGCIPYQEGDKAWAT